MDIKRKLMEEVGLSVNKRGEFTDQDTLQTFKINNKVAKEYNIRKNEVEFNPLGNQRHSEQLLKYCDAKDELNILSYGTNSEKDGTYSCTVTTKTSKITSSSYKNPALGYVENIFKLYGEDVDLSELDVKEDKNDNTK